MKTKHKILVVLALLAVFGLGAAAGVLGERYFMHKKYRRPSAEKSHPPSLESWAKELGLTEDQQARIREIFKKNEERMKAYRTESHDKLGEIRRRLRSEIDAVLTPEQKKKNEEMIRRFEDRRKNDPERNSQRDRGAQDKRSPDRGR